jgi:glycosyltransferase involved in cell wall biosynthesis
MVKKKLLILSESAQFPWGMAASNRIRNLLKALKFQNWNTEYLGLRGANVRRQKGKEYPYKGISNGILYQYPGPTAYRSTNWWMRRIDDIVGWLFTVFLVSWKKVTKDVDVVMIYSRNKNVTGFWIPFLNFLNIPLILEMCEWPLALAQVQKIKNNDAQLFCNNHVPKVDGALPISTYIEQEIKRVASNKKQNVPIFKIPILIDVPLAHSTFSKKAKKPYLLYCGAIGYMDIARIVVDIVHELKACGFQIPVVFTGKEDSNELSKLISYATKREVLPLLKFMGFIPESELHQLMKEATCLLAPLPENLQSESRFPTKIGYYLASGAPVITNKIGDVQIYLKDGINAFVAEKCSAEQFASKIIQCIEQSDIAEKIGSSGRKLALEKFHYTKACEGLSDFVHQVIQEYKK